MEVSLRFSLAQGLPTLLLSRNDYNSRDIDFPFHPRLAITRISALLIRSKSDARAAAPEHFRTDLFLENITQAQLQNPGTIHCRRDRSEGSWVDERRIVTGWVAKVGMIEDVDRVCPEL